MLLPAVIAVLVLVLLGLLVPTLFLLWVSAFRSRNTTTSASLKRSAAVVVLGDIGRSPRMCYHVESLANEGWKVGIVGYAGVELPPRLRRATIKHHVLSTPPKWIASLPRAAFVVVAPFKVLLQTLSLFWLLTVKVNPPPEVIMVQTPPALPTLFVVRFVSLLLRSRVIIDWHNLGYTILALRLSASHPLVRLAEWLEKVTGRHAFAHLFVTKAMMRHLGQKWQLQGRMRVLHDRPPEHFRRATVAETHLLFCSLMDRLNAPMAGAATRDMSARDAMATLKVSAAASDAMLKFWPPYTLPQNTPFTVTGSDAASPTGPGSSGSGVAPATAAAGVDAGQRLSTPQPSTPIVRTLRNEAARSSPPAYDEAGSVAPGSGHSSPASILDSRLVDLHGAAPSDACWREDRPAIAVSSTSWTADEDFGILLLAASLYERRARELHAAATGVQDAGAEAAGMEKGLSHQSNASWDSHHSAYGVITPSSELAPAASIGRSKGSISRSRRPRSDSFDTRFSGSNASRRQSATGALLETGVTTLPKLLIIVTGKGELRAQYEAQIAKMEREMDWQWVRIRTAWLESEEYPILLGSADIGISLHSSSSGLDLPMKVVDMLGCGLPVLALDFPCLDELVIDGLNGLTFSDAAGLERGLEAVLAGFPHHNTQLHQNLVEHSAFPSEEDSIPGIAGRVDDDEEDEVTLADARMPLLRAAALSLPGQAAAEPGESQPLTPTTPTFSMLASPKLPSFLTSDSPERRGSGSVDGDVDRATAAGANGARGDAARRKRNKAATWRGNWKRVVRPLLLIEEPDAADTHLRSARSALWAAQPGGASAAGPPRKFLHRGTTGKARSSEESIRSPSSPLSDTGHWPAPAASALASHASTSTPDRTAGALRYRAATADTDATASSHLSLSSDDAAADIPHIHVSGA